MQMQFSKSIVIFIVILNFLFTAAVLYIFLKTSVEPTVLTGAWFSFTTVELWQLANIKKQRIKKKIEEDEAS